MCEIRESNPMKEYFDEIWKRFKEYREKKQKWSWIKLSKTPKWRDNRFTIFYEEEEKR